MSKHDAPPPYGVNPHMYPTLPPEPAPATVVMTNTVVQYGPEPQHSTCPYCHAQIRTTVNSEATTKTHISALLLCCFLCWPCACLPYCMDSCQNRNHYCPNCKAFLGTYAS